MRDNSGLDSPPITPPPPPPPPPSPILPCFVISENICRGRVKAGDNVFVLQFFVIVLLFIYLFIY